jgi:hypothetical protein
MQMAILHAGRDFCDFGWADRRLYGKHDYKLKADKSYVVSV